MKFKKNIEELEIRGKLFKIDTDFRTWISLEKEVTEAKNDEDSFKPLLNFALSQNLPICRETFDEILSFFVCGKKKENSSGSESHQEPSIDFEKDEELIFCAFLTQYRINLRADYLHWWDFMAMLNGLTEEHTICKIMGYRTMDLSKIDKKLRPEYQKLKDKYSLTKKHFATLEDRNNALRERVKKIQKEVEKRGK